MIAVQRPRLTSHPFHEAIHHLLLARPVERDGELVALDVENVAVAEFLVEHAVAGREGRDGAGGFRHQLAFDGERPPFGSARAPARGAGPGRAGVAEAAIAGTASRVSA